MGILFVVALLLAWPTFGLSILVWIVLLAVQTKGKVNKVEQRHERKGFIEPLFANQYAEFYYALLGKYASQRKPDYPIAHQGGRLIMNYIAHNPEEAALFMKGLQRIPNSRPGLATALEAVEYEKAQGDMRYIHLVAYNGIQTMKKQNPDLRCFDKFSEIELCAYILQIDANFRHHPLAA